ncbi:MAG: helix-turn-helix domain-containing protein [Nanoarchaeota archaeon]|nr:helix-turn-helix domain-containing protein [Nanoarchaeota archaeon]
MNYETQLKEAGLTGNEAKVYNQLLKRGSISANELAKEIGLDRSLTYTILNNLIEKGLVNHIKKANKKFFEAANLENLLNPVKEKENFIKDLIPKLKEIEKKEKTPFNVAVYEGREGLRTVMKEFMKHKDSCGFGSTGRAYDEFYESKHWIRDMTKNKANLRLIMSNKFKGHKFTKAKLVNVKYLNVDSETTTMIFGDTITIHSIIDKPRVIVIKDKHIAESYRNYFEILWKSAKK